MKKIIDLHSKMLIMFLLVLFMGGGAIITSVGEVSAQCAVCKANVEVSGQGKNPEKKVVGSGLNMGIIYLLCAPYILIGGIAYYWFKNNKNKEIGNTTQSDPDHIPFNFNIKK